MVVNWKQMFTAALGPFHLGEEKFHKLCTATPCFRHPPPPHPLAEPFHRLLCESILHPSMAVESGSICPSVTGLLHSARCPAGSSVSPGSAGSPALSLLKAVQVKYAENWALGTWDQKSPRKGSKRHHLACPSTSHLRACPSDQCLLKTEQLQDGCLCVFGGGGRSSKRSDAAGPAGDSFEGSGIILQMCVNFARYPYSF